MATVTIAESLAAHRRALLRMCPDVQLPELPACNGQALLRDAVLGNDMLIFAWGFRLRADLCRPAVIDLGSRLRPRLPREPMVIDLAFVQRAGRKPLPAAQRLIGRIVKAGAKAPA
ncbi:MAG: hypothetical protein KGL43_04490 [Burkholderiales bacterium]|nr:hypothetical protein [Burkholderiales bacterium]